MQIKITGSLKYLIPAIRMLKKILQEHNKAFVIKEPACMSYARSNDKVSIVADVETKFIDYEVFQEKEFLYVEVLLTGTSFSFYKKNKSYRFLYSKKEAIDKNTSIKAHCYNEDLYVADIDTETGYTSFMGSYDDLETYEAKLVGRDL